MEDLSCSEMTALAAIEKITEKHERITNRQLREYTGLSSTTVRSILKKLSQKKYVQVDYPKYIENHDDFRPYVKVLKKGPLVWRG